MKCQPLRVFRIFAALIIFSKLFDIEVPTKIEFILTCSKLPFDNDSNFQKCHQYIRFSHQHAKIVTDMAKMIFPTISTTYER